MAGSGLKHPAAFDLSAQLATGSGSASAARSKQLRFRERELGSGFPYRSHRSSYRASPVAQANFN
ncbi:GM23115 [Drosophila sechellia]|uniref:GM23115 n=1 Tax=Drosophila sechellia TaxID=7238 RepID=B4IIB9_DROSE|nr:GM23115 [Drosophila sechellia]